MTTFNKLDTDSIELTHKQTIFRADLLSEKETLEARLNEINEMLGVLDEKPKEIIN